MPKLLAVHNVFEDKLHFSHKLGGLACPSLAIIRDDLPYSNYGPITLVAKSSLIDPAQNQVFNSDIYSPRFPNTFYEANDEKLKDAMSTFNASLEEINDDISLYSISNNIEQKGVKGFMEALRVEYGVKIAFLRHKDVPVKAPLKAPDLRHEVSSDPRVQTWFEKNNHNSFGWDDHRFLELGEIIRKVFDEQSQLAATKEADNKEAHENYQEVYDDVFGFTYESKVSCLQATPNGLMPTVVTICDIEDDLKKIGSANEILDRESFDSLYQDFFNKYDEEYDSWLFNLGKDIPEAPWFYDANGTKKPVELNDVVKEMKKVVRDGEVASYGVGQIRALVSNQFQDFEDIDLHAHQIVDKDELEAEKSNIEVLFNDLIDTLTPYYRFDSERMGFRDEVIYSIKDYVHKGVKELNANYDDLPEYIIDDIDHFLDYLKNAKTTYFEAKFDRAVKISEFEVAIIPDNLSEDTTQIIEDSGLKVIHYKAGNELSRMAAFRKVDKLSFGHVSIDHTKEKTNKDNEFSI